MHPPGALADGKMHAKCVPQRPMVARFRFGAFPGGDPWQLFRFMRSRRDLGREKRQFAATYRRHASKMSWLWQDMRAVHPKSPANSRLGIHRAKILPGGGPFRCARPPQIMHGAQILPFLGAPFERFGLSRAGRGRCSRFAHCPPLLCTGGAVVSRVRPHAASSCPQPCRRVRDEAETAGSCRLPQKTWRCDGVSLNCRCSAVLF